MLLGRIFNKIKRSIEINNIAIDKQFNPSPTSSYYIIRRGILKAVYENRDFMKGPLLDFGCGSKPYKPIFNHIDEYIGIDFHNDGHSHHNEDIDFFYDGKKIPFNDNRFNSILSTEVFEHIFNPDELLKELNRVLAPDGYILITCPFVYPEHETPFDYARYTHFALKYLLEKNGFEIIVYDKKGNALETICQQTIIYLFSFLNFFGPLKRNQIFVKLFNSFIATIFNVFVKTVGKLLPSSYHFYTTNVVVAKKINSVA